MKTRHGVCAARALVLALAAPNAWAQDSAAAEALFDRGVADMEAGRLEKACPAIQESNRIDPRPGTMFTLAECEAKWNKVASAVAHYADYLRMVSQMPPAQHAKHADRAQTAEAQMAKLRTVVPQLTVTLPAGAPKGTVVKRDGIELGAASLGAPLPVDPGEHVITTQVPGGREHAVRVVIAMREKKTVQLEVRMPVEQAEGVGRQASGVGGQGSAEGGQGAGAGRRTAAYVAGGIGAAGLLVGAVTGVMSLGKKGTVDENCTGTVCSGAGKEAGESGRTLADVSTVGFAVGALGLGTAAVLWLTARGSQGEAKARRWEPVVAAGPGGDAALGVRGAC